MLGAQTGLYKLWSKEKEQSQETQLGAQTGLYKEIDSTNDAKSKKVLSTNLTLYVRPFYLTIGVKRI